LRRQDDVNADLNNRAVQRHLCEIGLIENSRRADSGPDLQFVIHDPPSDAVTPLLPLYSGGHSLA
jgi:hypothetical protein